MPQAVVTDFSYKGSHIALAQPTSLALCTGSQNNRTSEWVAGA